MTPLLSARIALVVLAMLIAMDLWGSSFRFLTPRPAFVPGPADVHVQVYIPRHPDNRRLVVAWDSADGDAGQFDAPVDGVDAPAVMSRWLRALSAGEYVFAAELHGTTGVRARARTTLTVVR